MADEVVLYVVPGCPLCEAARVALRGAGTEFAERDVANDFSARRRMFKATRQNLVPVIETGGAFYVRPTREEISKLTRN